MELPVLHEAINIMTFLDQNFDGLVQACSNSIANALELLQSCTKPSNCKYVNYIHSTN